MLGKDFPVFDCDAHVVEPAAVLEYVPAADRDLVRDYYWTNEDVAPMGLLNGRRSVIFSPGYRSAGAASSIRGPGFTMDVQRALYTRPGLTDEQQQYMDHAGTRDP